MADKNYNARAVKHLPPPASSIAEITYRDYRIVQTSDPNWLGAGVDSYGFTNASVFVVMDEFDDLVMPIGMQAHWTVYDAIAAIEMRDTLHPQIVDGGWPSGVLHEFNRMQRERRSYWRVDLALVRIRKACVDAADFDDNPGAAVLKEIDDMHVFLQQQSNPSPSKP